MASYRALKKMREMGLPLDQGQRDNLEMHDKLQMLQDHQVAKAKHIAARSEWEADQRYAARNSPAEQPVQQQTAGQIALGAAATFAIAFLVGKNIGKSF